MVVPEGAMAIARPRVRSGCVWMPRLLSTPLVETKMAPAGIAYAVSRAAAAVVGTVASRIEDIDGTYGPQPLSAGSAAAATNRMNWGKARPPVNRLSMDLLP